MPCGFRDKRRQGHRCVQCRENHRKCNGFRPCQYCKVHSLKCGEPLSMGRAITMVEYHPPPTNLINRILGHDNWRYVQIFFDAVISDSLFLSTYNFDEIGSLVHQHESVYEAVVAVGATYANEILTDSRPPPARKPDLEILCAKLRRSFTSDLCKPAAKRDPLFLLRASLLGFIEVMTDSTGKRWGRLVHTIQHVLSTQEDDTLSAMAWYWPLLSCMRFCIAICDVMFENSLPCTLCSRDSQRQIPLVSGPQKELLTSRVEKIEYLSRLLDRWARLKLRSIYWLKNMKNEKGHTMNHQICPGDVMEKSARGSTLAGLEIICDASELQQDIIGKMLCLPVHTGKFATHDEDCVLPFYHWILTGLSHMFLRPEWHVHDWKLPIMEAALINEQALLALDGAEQMLQKPQLDAPLYAAILPIVCVQFSAFEDRQRIMEFRQSFKRRGFAIVSEFESDVIKAWTEPEVLSI